MHSLRIRHERRRDAFRQLKKIHSERSNVLVVHYSCESFLVEHGGRSPRVTSIAVREFATGQTRSFSIQIKAERAGTLTPRGAALDDFERGMLEDFFAFLQDNTSKTWVHWNMRDQNYGFAALEHRYAVLGGTPSSVPPDRRVDLARLLVALYGKRYAGHPRLAKLVEMNHISKMHFLDGEGESNAYEAEEFHKLHRSTLTKVDVLANIVGRTVDGSLITKIPRWQLWIVDYIGGLVWLSPWIMGTIALLGSLASILALAW